MSWRGFETSNWRTTALVVVATGAALTVAQVYCKKLKDQLEVLQARISALEKEKDQAKGSLVGDIENDTRGRSHGLSARGSVLAAGHAPPCYIMEHIMRLGKTYCAQERPDGYICLSISENRLAYPLYHEVLAAGRPNDISSTGYDNPRGGVRIRKAVADFLSQHVARRPGGTSHARAGQASSRRREWSI